MCCNNCNDPVCQCADGIDGKNIWTLTTANFTQPASSNNVQITTDSTLQYSNQGFGTDQIIYIEGGGYYQVVSLDSTTTMTIKNLGYTGNAAPAATISSGAKVSPAGIKGADGSSGAGGTSLLYNNHTVVDSTGTGNQVLKTYTVASGTLADGDALRVTGLCTITNPIIKSVTVGMYITNTLNTGNTLITNYGSTSPTDKTYEISVLMTRVSSTSLAIKSIMIMGSNDPILGLAGSPVIGASQSNYAPSIYKDITVSDLDSNDLVINMWCNPTDAGDTVSGQFLTIEKLEI